jgi:hypothetical protein
LRDYGACRLPFIGGDHANLKLTRNRVQLKAARCGQALLIGDDIEGLRATGEHAARAVLGKQEHYGRAGHRPIIPIYHTHDGFARRALPHIVHRTLALHDLDSQRGQISLLTQGYRRRRYRRSQQNQ